MHNRVFIQMFYVYKITNITNKKIYIGKSNNPVKRWKRHIYDASKGKTGLKQIYFHKAINKYGANNFIVEIISEHILENDAINAEVELIKKLSSNNHEIGYNSTLGGQGVSGYKRTLAQKIAISIRNSGKNNGQFGKKYSLEERKILGKKISEAKNKSSSKLHKISEETIIKLKNAVKDKSSQKLTDEQKDLIIIMYDSGKFLKRELAEQFQVEEKTIRYVIRYWKEVKNNKANYLTQSQKDQIIELYLKNEYTKKQISKIVNLPNNRVESVIKMYRNKLNKST